MKKILIIALLLNFLNPSFSQVKSNIFNNGKAWEYAGYTGVNTAGIGLTTGMFVVGVAQTFLREGTGVLLIMGSIGVGLITPFLSGTTIHLIGKKHINGSLGVAILSSYISVGLSAFGAMIFANVELDNLALITLLTVPGALSVLSYNKFTKSNSLVSYQNGTFNMEQPTISLAPNPIKNGNYLQISLFKVTF